MGTMEQAVPVQADWLNFNKFTLRADRAFQLGPLTYVIIVGWAVCHWSMQLGHSCKNGQILYWSSVQTFTCTTIDQLSRLWLGGKGGVVAGELPPYDAFTIGGTNSVRGYHEGTDEIIWIGLPWGYGSKFRRFCELQTLDPPPMRQMQGVSERAADMELPVLSSMRHWLPRSVVYSLLTMAQVRALIRMPTSAGNALCTLS